MRASVDSRREVDPPAIGRPGRNVLIALRTSDLQRRASSRVDGPDVPMSVIAPRIESDLLPVGRPVGRALPTAGPVRELVWTCPVCIRQPDLRLLYRPH